VPDYWWAPAIPDVARHIPTRTRDTRTPGSDKLINTFSPYTTPDDTQAQAAIDAACGTVLSQVGKVDLSDVATCNQARVAAEWRAAADIELAYPNRDADIRLYAMLDQRAKDELDTLIKRIEDTGESTIGLAGTVAWKAPEPPPWADKDPDYRYVPGYVGSPGAAAVRERRARTEPGGG
jgi:hypothetical protein